MFGILGLVLVGIAVWLGVGGISWFWCLLLAVVGGVLYYGIKAESGHAHLIVSDLQEMGVVKWGLWIFFTQLLTVSIFYGVGYLFK